ncbi:hypothetical protein ACFWN7_12295 [Agromyces sp. NPDC058484]|uniref:hypothetical protein n=1 Tax=Agromyces sp. NPDC058484 TaxID=3346524 RepID=UPI0036464EAF
MNVELPRRSHGFMLARDATALGVRSELESGVATARLERVRRGVYADVVRPDPKLPAAQREAMAYLRDVRAAGLTLRAPVFTAHSAIALYELPIVGAWPAQVYVMAPGRSGHRRRGVTALARTRDIEVHLVGGLAVTSVEYSLIQLSRHGSLAAALTATDAAIHVSRRSDDPPPLTTLAQLRAEHERLLPYPGSRRTDAVLRRATHLADTPLETASRLVIEELGFPAPELQHRLWLPELRRVAFLDFHWPEFGVGAEADGRGKYLGDGTVEASADVVIDEKAREDAIRRQVRAFTRWDWPEMWGRRVLAAKLRAAGLPVVRPSLKLF